MRALVATANAATPLELREVEEPAPAPDESVVAVRAVSINRGELRLLSVPLIPTHNAAFATGAGAQRIRPCPLFLKADVQLALSAASRLPNTKRCLVP
jgi:hypothetical protein